VHTDRCGNTGGQKCHAKGSRKETEIQQFMYRDTVNVEHEMYDYNGSNWSHRNSNKRFKETFGSHNRKIFKTVTTKDSCTWNITRNTESTDCSLELEALAVGIAVGSRGVPGRTGLLQET
jgi:hypothetical protein